MAEAFVTIDNPYGDDAEVGLRPDADGHVAVATYPLSKATANEPGKTVNVGTSSSTVVSSAEADGALKVVFANNSDAVIWLNFAETGAVVGEGVPLEPGDVWVETHYIGPFSARATAAASPLAVTVV